MTGLWYTAIFACCLVSYAAAGTGTLQTINGVLVNVVDNCKPGDDSTCPAGQCCVKEGMAYIPEFTGPKPQYAIACKPYRKRGEFCYTGSGEEFCPCDTSLHCNAHGLFGHCA